MKTFFSKLVISLVCLCICITTVNLFTNAENTETTLSADKCLVYVNEEVNFVLDNTSVSSVIEWYVNDIKIEHTDSTYVFSSKTTGTYVIYAKVDGNITSIKKVEVIEKEDDLISLINYSSGINVVENFDSYGNTEPIPGIANTLDFKVTNDGSNGYLESIKSEWGGSPWYGLGIGQYGLVDDYEISFDVTYPDNVYGIAGIQAGAIVNGAPYEILCLHYMENGTAILYSNGGSGQLYNSSDENNGGVGNSFRVIPGTALNLKMIKIGNKFFIYANDVLMVKKTINLNFSTLLGVSFIQFLEGGTKGVQFDNLQIKGFTLNSTSSSLETIVDQSFDITPLSDAYGITYINGNPSLIAIKSEGGMSPWFATEVNPENLVDYKVSYDVMFPSGCYGISGFQLGGIVDNNAYEIACVQMNADGTSFIYANGIGGQIINSLYPALGGVGATSPLKFDKWSKVVLEKNGQNIKISIDGVLLVNIDLTFNFTKMQGFAFTQYLFDGTKGLLLDNLVVEKIVDSAPSQSVQDVFDQYGITDPVCGIAGTYDFKVSSDGTNSYLESVKTEWGGSPWFVLDVGNYNFIDNYEVSYDFMFPKDVYGIAGIQLGGAVDGVPYEFGCIHLYENGVSQVYTNGVSGILMDSLNPALGGVGVTNAVEQGKWQTLRIVKIGQHFNIYIDDILVVNQTVNLNFTKLLGICFIQFLEGGTVGVRYDNVCVKTISDSIVSSNKFDNVILNNTYVLTNDNGNTYIKAAKSEGGISPWMALEVFPYDLVDYRVSYDVMFPTGCYGIAGFQLGGIVENNAYEIACLQMNSDGTSFIYANGVGGQIINSSDPALGGVGATSPLKFDKWSKVLLDKKGNHFDIYIDEVLMVSIDLSLSFTKMQGFAFTQYLFDGTTGVSLDNLKVERATSTVTTEVPLEEVSLLPTSIDVACGNVVGFKLDKKPYNATIKEVSWYVNDVLVQGATSDLLNYFCSQVGKYKINAVVNGITTKPKVINVYEETPITLVDTSNWEAIRSENFEFWDQGTAWGAPNPDVLKSDGNGHVEHQKDNVLAKCGMFWDFGGESFPKNYVLKHDFNFSENAVGSIKWSISGFFTNDASDVANIFVKKTLEGVEVGIYNGKGDLVCSSSRESLGSCGVLDNNLVKYNEWHTLSVYKVEDVISISIDDVEAVRTRIDNSKDANVAYCIITTDFASIENSGCMLDNCQLLVEATESDTVDVVTISVSKSSINVNESVSAYANVFPDDVDYDDITWYVNGSKVEGNAIERDFNFDKAGNYRIKCVIDGVESPEKVVIVTEKVETSSGCSLFNARYVFASLGLLSIVYIFLKKKH